MHLYAAAFAASFIHVFLKAVQQRNVAFLNYGWVPVISLGMAATEVYVIASVANNGWHVLIVLAIGLGGGAGAMLAMWSHNKWIMKHD
jgi:ABC-type uncharacterized transport system ATPase subunit